MNNDIPSCEQIQAELSRIAEAAPADPLGASAKIMHELAGMTMLLDQAIVSEHLSGEGQESEAVRKYATSILFSAASASQWSGNDNLFNPSQSPLEIFKGDGRDEARDEALLTPSDISNLVRGLGGVMAGLAAEPPDSERTNAALADVVRSCAEIIRRSSLSP